MPNVEEETLMCRVPDGRRAEQVIFQSQSLFQSRAEWHSIHNRSLTTTVVCEARPPTSSLARVPRPAVNGFIKVGRQWPPLARNGSIGDRWPECWLGGAANVVRPAKVKTTTSVLAYNRGLRGSWSGPRTCWILHDSWSRHRPASLSIARCPGTTNTMLLIFIGLVYDRRR